MEKRDSMIGPFSQDDPTFRSTVMHSPLTAKEARRRDTVEKTLGLDRTMTYKAKHPMVKFVSQAHETGIK